MRHFGFASVFVLGYVSASLSFGLGLPSVLGDELPANQVLLAQFADAKRLNREGQYREAFLKFMQVPGGESMAIRLATRTPEVREYLDLLRSNVDSLPAPTTKVVEGELWLAMKDQPEALACFRDAAATISVASGKNGDPESIPRSDYFVEPPESISIGFGSINPAEEICSPFILGPGSHRDNRLIRRFIALEAWDDAGREFARVWEFHRQASRPYVATVRVLIDDDVADSLLPENVAILDRSQYRHEKQLFNPVGFNGQGLQFALDYAYFLYSRKEPNAARALLLEPLLTIDMDRDPNAWLEGKPVPLNKSRPAPERVIPENYGNWHHGRASGVSRKEFIRLVYGDAQLHGYSEELIGVLNDKISAGVNRLRRVLAIIRGHQGLPDAALDLELAYIAAEKFDPLTAALRRGLVFEDARKLPEATAAFEATLEVPLSETKNIPLPDPDEITLDTGAPFNHQSHWRQGDISKKLHPVVMKRLLRLYEAQGATDKLLEMTLRDIEVEPDRLANLKFVEELLHKFRAARREERITDWIKQRLSNEQKPALIIPLAWVVDQKSRAVEAVAASFSPGTPGLSEWESRIRQSSSDLFKQFLKTRIKSYPIDYQSRLELLELDGRLESQDAIECLELLLENGKARDFQYRGNDPRSDAQFSNYYDLSYRLMRLYERHGKLEELRRLGLRMANELKPFDRDSLSRFPNHVPDEMADQRRLWGEACLGLAIQYANTPTDQLALSEALASSHWGAAKTQIARRLEGPWRPKPPEKAVPWSNAPANVTLLVSHDNVISLAHDDEFVYAGYAWGVTVSTHRGQIVTQVALGDVARFMIVAQDTLWVGTPKGLFRITKGRWTVAYHPLNSEAASETKNPHRQVNGIEALEFDGELLWIAESGNAHALNTKTREWRTAGKAELKLDKPGQVRRIKADGDYVWVDGDFGLRRWSRPTDEWSIVESPNRDQLTHLVEIVDGTVYGDVSTIGQDHQRRLCRIDPETLAVKLIPIVPKPDQRTVNSRLEYLGKSQGSANPAGWDGKPVFGDYYIDEQLLCAFPNSKTEFNDEFSEQRENARTNVDPRLGSVLRMLDRRDHSLARKGVPANYDWKVLTLPDGTLVAAHRLGQMRYEYPHEERRMWGNSNHDLGVSEGGLYFVFSPDERNLPLEQRIVIQQSGTLPADRVYDLVGIDEYDWLCTERGLVVLDQQKSIVDRFSRQQGLCANRVVGGTKLGPDFYFATGWHDHSGGLAVFDVATSTWMSFHHCDGMSTDKLLGLQAEAGHLKLTFAEDRILRSSGAQDRQFPPQSFDPQTRSFTGGGPPAFVKNNSFERRHVRDAIEPMPYLGGFILQRHTARGRTYLCGTRGMVIVDDHAIQQGQIPEIVLHTLDVRVTKSVMAQQLADARSRKPIINQREDLQRALDDDNPLYRANALATLYKKNSPPPVDDIPLIIGCLESPHRRVRCTAVAVLAECQNNDLVVPALQARLTEPDRMIRSEIVLDLARRGAIPDLPILIDFFHDHDHFEFPIGAESSIEVRSAFARMRVALATQASKPAFELLLQNLPRRDNPAELNELIAKVGQSLLGHPDGLETLLKFRPTHDERYDDSRFIFVRKVLGRAGPPLLPALHAALQSDDRVIRSNAARGCGAIHDPSSIDPLIKALDLESGLSRASIVWALGELKAKSALPTLTRLYVNARKDEQGSHAGYGAGFLAGQGGAAAADQFNRIRSLAAIGAEWNDLTATAAGPVVDPRHQEALLSANDILKAVTKIGAADAQEFYRMLAAESDHRDRREAAKQLAVKKEEDRKLNIPILNGMLTDSHPEVSLAAAVSLLILGQVAGQQPVLDGLKSESWGHALHELERLEKSQRSFARNEIEAIANDPGKSDEIRQYARHLIGTDR